MKTWKLIAGVLIIFILGALFGMLPGFYFRHQFPPPPPIPPRFADHEGRDFLLEMLTRDLALNENQAADVKKITTEMKKKLDAYFLRTMEELEKSRKEGFAEIEKVLDDNQKKKLHEMVKMMEKHMPSPGKMPPPPFMMGPPGQTPPPPCPRP